MTKTSVAQAIADAKELKKLAVEKARLDLAETVTPEIKAILEAALDETADKDADDEPAEEPMEETFNALMEKLKAEDPEKFEAVTAALAEKKAPESEEKPEEGEEKPAENTDETLDIDAALAEIEGSQELGENEEGEEKPEEGEEKPEEGAEEDEIDEDYISKILAEVEKEEGEEEDEKPEEGEEKPAEEDEIDEAADLKGLLDKVKTFSKEELDKFMKALQSISPEQVKKDMAAGKAVSVLPSNIQETDEASEDELLELKKELFEMNILSAKLLYQNKLLLSENFSDDQKARIIKAFDKAKTVGEVKVLFEALNVKAPKPTKTPIAESLGFRRIGQPITEAKTTTEKKYDEKDPLVVEMQRKAGIIK